MKESPESNKQLSDGTVLSSKAATVPADAFAVNLSVDERSQGHSAIVTDDTANRASPMEVYRSATNSPAQYNNSTESTVKVEFNPMVSPPSVTRNSCISMTEESSLLNIFQQSRVQEPSLDVSCVLSQSAASLITTNLMSTAASMGSSDLAMPVPCVSAREHPNVSVLCQDIASSAVSTLQSSEIPASTRVVNSSVTVPHVPQAQHFTNSSTVQLEHVSQRSPNSKPNYSRLNENPHLNANISIDNCKVSCHGRTNSSVEFTPSLSNEVLTTVCDFNSYLIPNSTTSYDTRPLPVTSPATMSQYIPESNDSKPVTHTHNMTNLTSPSHVQNSFSPSPTSLCGDSLTLEKRTVNNNVDCRDSAHHPLQINNSSCVVQNINIQNSNIASVYKNMSTIVHHNFQSSMNEMQFTEKPVVNRAAITSMDNMVITNQFHPQLFSPISASLPNIIDTSAPVQSGEVYLQNATVASSNEAPQVIPSLPIGMSNKKQKLNNGRGKNNSSFMSKFTNANFKEVIDAPTTNQPITSLIHSQSMAGKTVSSEDRKSSSAPAATKKKRKRDLSSLSSCNVNGDNSAAYGPLQDTSVITGSGDTVVAQPATSPIAALLFQSSLHNALTQEAAASVSSHSSCAFTDPVQLANNPTHFAETPRTPPLGNPGYNSSTRTVVSPAGFHPALSPTQSFTFPISACGNSNIPEPNIVPTIPTSLPLMNKVNYSNHSSSTYLSTHSSSMGSPCSSVLTYNQLSTMSPPISSSYSPITSMPSPRSSYSHALSGAPSPIPFNLVTSMPSPTYCNISPKAPNVRNLYSSSIGSLTPPPPYAQHSILASHSYINSSMTSQPRITSPVMSLDSSMLYTSSRIAAGSSMSPPLSSLLSSNNHMSCSQSSAGVMTSNHTCLENSTNTNQAAAVTMGNMCRNSARPLLSPPTILSVIPFSSISPDIANLEPPLPNASAIPALSELELTPDDLPRLLSTGDSSSQSCGASKLLDTNTADLTEIIQKLQEVTEQERQQQHGQTVMISSREVVEIRPPGPSFKGVLQSKSESELSNSTGVETQRVPENGNLPSLSMYENSHNVSLRQSSLSLEGAMSTRTSINQASECGNLRNSSSQIASTSSLITSFTDALSSNLSYPLNQSSLSVAPGSVLHGSLNGSALHYSNGDVASNGLHMTHADMAVNSANPGTDNSSTVPANVTHHFNNFQ